MFVYNILILDVYLSIPFDTISVLLLSHFRML